MTNKTHDDLVADWKENSEKHDDENCWFLRSLKQRSFKKVDRIALELHQEAFSIVDCTKCANCCRTLRVVVTDDDIPSTEWSGRPFLLPMRLYGPARGRGEGVSERMT